MGHYLSDMLPDATSYCLTCGKGIYPKSQIDAWQGFLKGCKCTKPSPKKIECKSYKKYKAKRPPTCGCIMCETKWKNKLNESK